MDHILVTDGLDDRVDGFSYAHFDNDYFMRDDETDGHHVSDHDPPVVTLATSPCADPDTRPTVVVGARVLEAPNAATANGCTINDLLPARDDFANHGAYVSAVSALSDERKAQGLISGAAKGQITSAAARNR